ncbi:MAG: histidine kinase [Chitinophagaceae bacterium]|nr:histidine kinase [Chitinophagaceae bacterium]
MKTANGIVISSTEWEWEHNIHELKLNYNQNQNFIYIGFGVNDFNSVSNNQFAYKIDGVTNGWILTTPMNMDSSGAVIAGLKHGKYLFELKVKTGDEDWRKQQAKMIIIVSPPFWQTWWFWASVILGLGLIIGLLMWWRIRTVKRKEKEKFAHEKQMMELEAMALRAQMNPHFIFNCLNSIKSLMQEKETEKGMTYLTTFSKLIRTLFNNADKKLISLYDEIETCKFYLQLEALRFDTKFSYAVNIDETIDLKSIQVPALIIQPFIENAIWHGIVPRKSSGHVSLKVTRKYDIIEVAIDDDGIGRETSQQNRSTSGLVHQSKGVNLTQTRLELNNLLQQRHAELEVIDKKDENGIATGTTVIIKIKEEQL